MAYKSYSSSAQKLAKLWEDVQDNSASVEILKRLDLSYLSQNVLKSPRIVDVYNRVIVDASAQYTVELSGLPEDFIHFVHPQFSYQISSAYDITKEIPSFMFAFANGDLKNGNIMITDMEQKWWWTKLGNSCLFTFRPSVIIQVAQDVSESGFSGVSIPVYMNVQLHIINKRDYNAIQSGK